MATKKQYALDLTNQENKYLTVNSTATGLTFVSLSSTTLQQAYSNSTNPEIITNSTQGAISIQNGQTLDTASQLEVKNNSGSTTFNVNGSGTIMSPQIIGGTGITSTLIIQGTSGGGTGTTTGIQMRVGNNGSITGMTMLNNGKVGIGKVPDYELEVGGVLNPSIIVRGNGASSSPTIGFTTLNGFGIEGFKFYYNGALGHTYFDNYYSQGNMVFRTNVVGTPIEAMTILKDGKIKILNPTSGSTSKNVLINNNGIIEQRNDISFKTTNTYRIATTGGDYTSVQAAFTAINLMTGTTGIRLVLDAGVWLISDTVTINATRPIYFEGSGINTTFIRPTTGLTNKPMFSVLSSCNFNKLTFESTGLTDYGTLSTENCINLNTTESIEIDNFKISGFYDGINIIKSPSLFVFNFVVENSQNYAIDVNTNTTMSNVDIEVGTIENCNGINLLSGSGSVFDISTVIFSPGSGHTGITYVPATYTYSDHPSIHSCKWTNEGVFFTGFEFSRTDGRDANIVISNNIGSEDKLPHAYLNLVNNTTPTILGNNVWTKLNFTGTTLYQNKIIFTGNRFTYLPTNRRDLMVWGSGAITTNSSQANIELALIKNGNTGTTIAPISITLDQNDRKFQWSANGYLDGVNAGDYYEIWGRGAVSQETIIFEDFNWLIKSM